MGHFWYTHFGVPDPPSPPFNRPLPSTYEAHVSRSRKKVVNNEEQPTWAPTTPRKYCGLYGPGHRIPPPPTTKALCQPPPPHCAYTRNADLNGQLKYEECACRGYVPLLCSPRWHILSGVVVIPIPPCSCQYAYHIPQSHRGSLYTLYKAIVSVHRWMERCSVRGTMACRQWNGHHGSLPIAMCRTLRTGCLCLFSFTSAGMPCDFSFVVDGKQRFYATCVSSKCSE